MTSTFLANLSHYVPEVMAVVTMIGLLFLEAAYSRFERGHAYVYFGSLIGLSFVLIALCMNISIPATPIFTNAVVIDPFSTLLKIVMTLGTLGAIYLSVQSEDIYSNLKSEFVILCVGVLVGGMLLASANNLLTVYIGIETLSILSYVLSALKKNDGKSTEAGLKYALYGGVTSGVMLFGMSHIYGTLGSIQFAEIISMMGNLSQTQNLILLPSFLLVFVGLGYKIACVPFHMWSPDVYEGSPIPVTAFFSIVPKIAGIAVMVRITYVFFGQEGLLQESWVGILQIVAALTMTVGNVLAIGQKSVKRMLAYSSISHAGFMLMGVLVVNQTGNSSIVFYAVAYLFMTLVAFGVTSFLSNKYDSDRFEIFNGLIKVHPLMAIVMSVIMFSLGGLPPFAGFVAKFNIFYAVVESSMYTIAVIAAINSLVSLYYYLRIIRLMVFAEPNDTDSVEGFSFVNQLALAGICVPVFVLGIFWDKLMIVASNAEMIIK